MTEHIEELKTLIAEIESLNRPEDMARRAQVCRAALDVRTRETSPGFGSYPGWG